MEDLEFLFPQYEDYHRHMVEILFYMKYFGHFSLEEVYGLPVFYRNQMLELLTKRLEIESGKQPSMDSHSGLGGLNSNQLQTLSNTDELKKILQRNNVYNVVNNDFPSNIKKII